MRINMAASTIDCMRMSNSVTSATGLFSNAILAAIGLFCENTSLKLLHPTDDQRTCWLKNGLSSVAGAICDAACL